MSRLVSYQQQASSSSPAASTIKSVIAGETIKKGQVITTARSKAYINKAFNFNPINTAGTYITNTIATCMLNATTGIKVGNNGTATAYAQLFTYNNGVITPVGSEVQISTKCYMPKVYKLDDTRFLVLGRESSSSNAVYAQVLSISGNTITVGTNIYINIYSIYLSMVQLTSTTFIIGGCYNNGNSTYMSAISINGNTISVIGTAGIGSQGNGTPSLYALSSTTCLMCGQPDSNGFLMFTIITLNGSILSYSTVVTTSLSYFYNSIFIMPTSDASKFIIVGGNNGNSLTYATVQVTGGTVTVTNAGTIYTIPTTYTAQFYTDGSSSIGNTCSSICIDTDKLLLNTNAYAIVVKVVGDSRIVAAAAYNNAWAYDCVSIIDNNKVLLSCSGSNRFMTVYSVFDAAINIPTHIFGIAMNDAISGQNVNVLTDGYDNSIFSALKVGSMYYNADGNLVDYNIEPSMLTLQGGGASTYRYNPDLYNRLPKPYAIALSATELQILNPYSRVGNL